MDTAAAVLADTTLGLEERMRKLSATLRVSVQLSYDHYARMWWCSVGPSTPARAYGSGATGAEALARATREWQNWRQQNPDW